MLKKLIYILLLVFSILNSQSYFNRIFPTDIQYGDARSMALAGSYVTTGTSSSIISRNPARLSYIANGEKGYSIDFQINSKVYFERRSIDILDSFGDFLTETDYVSNQFSNFYGSFGFTATDKKLKKGKIGGGASFTTLASFDYRFEEEVRYEEAFEDGESGSRDPLLGFHVYKNKGHLQLSSVGIGYAFDNDNEPTVSIGFSINKILESSISDHIYIDTAFYSENTNYYVNFSDIKEHEATYTTPSVSYRTYSIEFPLTIYSSSSVIILAGETEALLKTDTNSSYYIDSTTLLPWFLEYNSTTNQWEYIYEGVFYYKPKKYTFGLRLQKYRTLIVFETVEEKYKDVEYYPFADDVSEYKIGFEHKFKIGSDIRMGLSYKEPLIPSAFGPITKFTLGSNRQVNDKFNIDFAISYYITDYKYPDIFPTTSFINYDKITESNINISTTFKWDF